MRKRKSVKMATIAPSFPRCANCSTHFSKSISPVDKIISTWDFNASKGPEEVKIYDALAIIFETSPLKLKSKTNAKDGSIETNIFGGRTRTPTTTSFCSPCAKMLTMLYNTFMEFLQLCQLQSDVAIGLGQIQQLRENVFVTIPKMSKQMRFTATNCAEQVPNFSDDVRADENVDRTAEDEFLEPIVDMKEEDLSDCVDFECIAEEQAEDPDFNDMFFLTPLNDDEPLRKRLRLQPKTNSRYSNEEYVADVAINDENNGEDFDGNEDITSNDDEYSSESDSEFAAKKNARKGNKNGSRQCGHCDQFLFGMYGVKRHIRLCHKGKEFLTKCPQPDCLQLIRSDEEFLEHKEKHSSKVKRERSGIWETPRLCGHCDTEFATTQNLKVHTKRRHKGKEIFMKCAVPGCFEIMQTNENYRVHRWNMHGLMSTTRIGEKAVETIGSTDNRLLVHRKRSMQIWATPRLCGYCDTEFATTQNLKVHTKRRHKGKDIFMKCAVPGCFKIVKTNQDYKVHRLNVHGLRTRNRIGSTNKRLLCGHCDEEFYTLGTFKNHSDEQHEKEYLLKCPILECDQFFKSEEEFLAHRKEVHIADNNDAQTEFLTKCPPPDCLQLIHSEKELAENEEHISQSEKPSKDTSIWATPRLCGHCDTEFATTYNLKRHTGRKHKGKDIFMKCAVPGCFKIIQTNEDYKVHRFNDHRLGTASSTNKTVGTVGSTNKTLICGHCDEGFSTFRTFKNHSDEQHKKEYLVKCRISECDQLFKSEEQYLAHRKEVHTADNNDAQTDDSESESKRKVTRIREWNRKRRCGHCNKKYNTMSALRRHSELFHEEMEVLIKCPKSNCNEIFLTGKDFREHLDANHEEEESDSNSYASETEQKLIPGSKENIRYCGHCNGKFWRLTSLKRHCWQAHKGMSQIILIKCCECSETFAKDSEFKLHNEKCHPEESNGDESGFEFTINSINSTKRIWNVLRHCGICGRKCRGLTSLIRHFKRFHNGEELLMKCPQKGCRATFSNDDEFKTHRNSEHVDITTCSVCSLQMCSSELPEHLDKTHHARIDFIEQIVRKEIDRRIICEQCGFSCQSKIQHSRHLRTHRREEGNFEDLVPCSECKKLITKEFLAKHMLRHTEQPSAMCEQCGKSFFGKNLLKAHMQGVHGNEIFPCDQCDLVAKSKAHLRRHKMSKHGDGDRSLEHCEVCGMAAKQKITIARHIKRYHEVQECSHCDNIFSGERELENHNKDMHEEMECPHQCGLQLVGQLQLDDHLRTNHDEETSPTRKRRSRRKIQEQEVSSASESESDSDNSESDSSERESE